jgi:hypothetical protein
MNAVEFQQALDVVAARSDALVGGEERPAHRNEVVAIFAGTDLPGHTVLAWLTGEINAQLHHVPEMGVTGVLQGVALNAFLLGFECGRRSK